MYKKEPDFMIELHKIREKLSKKWRRIPPKVMLNELHDAGKWLKSQLRSASLK